MLHKEKPGRPLETNVEFYTAVLLDALGFPSDSFTCVFVAGRMPGWIAHAREQETSGRLIRPQSRYVGPAPAASRVIPRKRRLTGAAIFVVTARI